MSENDIRQKMVYVIMAGGAGTRFWPLSTDERPKQFLKLFGERSLIQLSYDRIAGSAPKERIMVLTNRSLTGLVRLQLPELPAENVIGEPSRRDTAAAVALAALLVRKRFGEDAVIVILTADHLIKPVDKFIATLESTAAEAAANNVLYTIGITPTYPATCYGYLERGEKTADDEGIEHFEMLRFKEKPDQETAANYLGTGRYYWNSGMFIWRAATILAEFACQRPDHLKFLQPAVDADGTAEFESALTKAFEPLESISVDFAIMEGAKSIRMVASNFEWDDVGGWLALEKYLDHDNAGNAFNAEVESLDSGKNIVFCEDGREELVALVGVENLIVVRSGGKTLITTRDKAERIKALVKKLDA